MGLKPVGNLYVINNGYVLRSVPSNGSITINDESFLIAFRKSDFPANAKLTKPKLTFTASRVPTCDNWDVRGYNRVVLGTPVVGNAYSLDSYTRLGDFEYRGKNAWYPGTAGNYYHGIYELRASSDGYVYFIINASAANVDGNIAYRTADQTFTFSNFDLTFTTDTTYAFGITSNFNGGYRNHRKAHTFEISTIYHSDVIRPYDISKGVFYFKKKSASSYRSITFTGTSVTVPAGAFEGGTQYDVYFSATASNGATATTSAVTLSTVDGEAVTTPVSPNNEVTHGDITFSWNFSNTTGESQYAFDLQTSTNNSTWTTILSHVVTSQTTATYTQTHAGDTYWRVRGYNQSDTAGAWSSSAHYVNNVPPQPPVILDVISGGRIHVRWSAENQIAYRIQVIQEGTNQLVYDSGDVYGSESLALVNTYLSNGNYTIRVKISNIYGNDSDWSTVQFQQTTELPALDYSAVLPAEGGVAFTINSEGFDKYYLVRNGELVAEFTEPTYTDLFASGEMNYRLIAVTSEDLFAQAVFTINVIVPSARLIALDGTAFTVSERWNSLNNVEQSEEIRYSANEYLGATAPEHIFSKMRLKRFTRAFYDPNRTASNLLGTVAFYADEYGNGDWVAITSVSRSDAWIGDDTNLEMQVTTRNEAITYDV